MLGTRVLSLWGRLVAEADSVLGLTAPLGAPPSVSAVLGRGLGADGQRGGPEVPEVVDHRGGDGDLGRRGGLEGPSGVDAGRRGGGLGHHRREVGRPRQPDTVQESVAATPTSKVELVSAWGPPLRLMVCPGEHLGQARSRRRRSRSRWPCRRPGGHRCGWWWARRCWPYPRHRSSRRSW